MARIETLGNGDKVAVAHMAPDGKEAIINHDANTVFLDSITKLRDGAPDGAKTAFTALVWEGGTVAKKRGRSTDTAEEIAAVMEEMGKRIPVQNQSGLSAWWDKRFVKPAPQVS